MRNKIIKMASWLYKPHIKKNAFRILLYHSVGQKDVEDRFNLRVSADNFHRQMECLAKESYNIQPLEKIIEMLAEKKDFPVKTVAITFDDGYKDNLDIATPILKKFNFTATFFLALDYIKREFKRERGYWERWGFLSWNEVRELAKMGFDIGSHSASHIKNPNFTDDAMLGIVRASKVDIEQSINKEIKLFSYPHGSVNSRLKSIVRKAGFIAACSSLWGVNSLNTDLFKLKRTEINSLDRMTDFQRKLSGRHDWRRYFQNA